MLKLFHVPVPALLGTIVIFGTLRATQYPLPMHLDFLFPFVQLMLGLFVWARVTRKAIGLFKGMIVPALIIIGWAATILFVIGIFLKVLG